MIGDNNFYIKTFKGFLHKRHLQMTQYERTNSMGIFIISVILILTVIVVAWIGAYLYFNTKNKKKHDNNQDELNRSDR